MMRFVGIALLGLVSMLDASHAFAEFDARLKWFGAGTSLPDRGLSRAAAGTPQFDQNLDLRLLWRVSRGDFTLVVDHTSAWVQGDGLAAGGNLNDLNQVIDSDDARAADLTWRIDQGSRHAAWHRLDRLALQFQRGDWAVTLGRDAVSWGSGLVFQPMDLFNPFTPTAVDRDFKPGSDLLLIERVTQSGADLQMLAIGRRDTQGRLTGQAGSVAVKWRANFGEGEYEVLAARHFADQVFGLGLRWPIGGALLRTDVVATRLRNDTTQVSAVVNLDYSFSVANRSAYVFAEYFHNGFGRSGDVGSLVGSADPLAQRLQRGEVFNLQRNYVALGATYQWHPLWSQTLTTITNLHDASSIVTTQLNYEPGDHQRLELGVLLSLGSAGDEFGGVPVAAFASSDNDPLFDSSGRPFTLGGQSQLFARWVYFL